MLFQKNFVLLRHNSRIVHDRDKGIKKSRNNKVKIRINTNQILMLCVVALLLLCIMSVYAPIRFDKQRAAREHDVIERLVKIRQAEEHYRQRYGIYTGNFRELINGGLITQEETLIPHSGGQPFELSVTTVIGKSGQQLPLMECGAQYQQYLDGLNENSITTLIEDANISGSYPGLKIGDLTTPNNNAGNWEN